MRKVRDQCAGDPDIVIDCQHVRSWHTPPPSDARPRGATVIAGHQADMKGTWGAYGDRVEAPAWRAWPGNPQALVWRSNANQRQPQLDSLEAISRMTYFDMVNQAPMLRQSPEEITISECLKALTT